MMELWAETHVGNVRANNEDSFAAVLELGLLVVADGLGGAVAGERASKITVEIVVDEVRAAGEALTPGKLLEIVELANRNVLDEARNDPWLRGMATTVTAAIVREGKLLIVNAGDSRAYRFRGGELECLTEDHSWIWGLAKERGVSTHHFKDHRFRHMLTKAIGGEDVVDADTFELDFAPGDILLLSSDGLHGVLTDEEIAAILSLDKTIRSKAKELIGMTLKRGAPDNVTVVLARNSDT